MDVLIAAATSPNPFVTELADALALQPAISSVRHDLDEFWGAPDTADVLHIHWPRALFTNWSPEGREDLRCLERTLEAWSDRVIINTVHNLHPHYRQTELYDDLNQLVFEYVDGFVHLGRVSRSLFQSEYPSTRSKSHEVIPHGRYDIFDNEVEQGEARQYLGLEKSEHVILAFGALRHPEELRLLTEGFEAFPQSDKRLVIAGRLAWSNGPVHRRVLRTYYRLRFFGQSIQSHFGAIKDNEVQYFLNACDQLVIPRKGILNSGDVALGFTFGRVVVGPNCGVIQEVLEKTGNPVYDPETPSSLSVALEEGSELAAGGKGEQNRNYAREHMKWEQIAQQHAGFYERLMENQLEAG